MYRQNAFKGAPEQPSAPRTVFLEIPEDAVRAYQLADRALSASMAALEEVTIKAKQARETYNHWRRIVDNPPINGAARLPAGVQEMWQRLGEAHVGQIRADKDVAEWSDVLARAERTYKEALAVVEGQALKAIRGLPGPMQGDE